MFIPFDRYHGHANYHNAHQWGERVHNQIKTKQCDPDWFIVAMKNGRFIPVFVWNDSYGFTKEYVVGFGNVLIVEINR